MKIVVSTAYEGKLGVCYFFEINEMKAQRKENGVYYLQPVVNGARKRVTLGKIRRTDAAKIAANITSILEHRKLGLDIPPDLIKWIAGLSSAFRLSLAEKGIIETQKVLTFREVFKKFMSSYKDGNRAQSTILRMQRSSKVALEVFGDTICDEITAEQVLEYERQLKDKLSESTWTKSLSDMKQVFNWGINVAKLINRNPISTLRGGRKSNPERMIYVSREAIDDVIKITDENSDWRLIFALARYAGLRIPSELARLKWKDIDFGSGTMNIFAPKTKTPRVVPIFPPLDKIILEAWEALSEGSKTLHVINDETRRKPSTNLRTTAMKLIDRAGVDVWEKQFQNLRMSCATEMINAGYPIRKVAVWLGHSVQVLEQHYIGTTGREIKEARIQNDNPFQVAK